MRIQALQSSFADGMISPRMQGMVELESYRSSLALLENMVVLPQGSVTRRPGTFFANSTPSNAQVRLVPFNRGQGTSVILEFSNNLLRFYANDGIIESGGSPYEVVTTYTTAQLADLSFTQSADVLFICHPTHPPRELKRLDVASWSLTELVLKDGPYFPVNTEDTTMTVSLAADGDWPGTSFTNSTLTAEEIITVTSSNVDPGTNSFTSSNHPFVNGQKVRFTGATGLAGNPVAGTYSQSTTTVTVTKSSHGFSVSDEVYLDHTSGDGVNGFYTVATVPDANTFTVTSGTSQTTSGDVEIATRITAGSDYYIIQATQNTFKLSTSSGGTPLLINAAPTTDVVFFQDIIDKNAYIKILASDTTGINLDLGFQSSDVGRVIRLNLQVAPQIKWGYAEILELDGSNPTTTILAKTKSALSTPGTTTEWQLGSFSETSGYPRTVQIFQQRLVFGGTSSEPQTIFFSQTGDFNNFAASEPLGQSTGRTDSSGKTIIGEQIFENNALSLTISSDTVDLIEWMNEDRRMTLGTSGGIFQIYGADDDLTVTPFNFTIAKVSAWATDATALPSKIGNNLLYVQQNGRKIRELAFDKLQDQYAAADLSLRAENLTESGIIGTAYQDQPYSVLWCRRTDGKLAGITYVDLLQMRAWHLHTIAGTHYDSTYGNHAKVESIAVIPRNTHDQLWMVVKRHKRETALASCTFNQSTDFFSKTSHGLSDGNTVAFDGTAIDGFSADTLYYVVSATTDTFQLSATSGGSAITVSGSTTDVSVTTLRKCTEVRYVEFMERYYVGDEIDPTDAHFVDSGLEEPTNQTTATTAVTGLSHLSGESVSILADASVQPNQTVNSSGEVTLQTAATKYRIGLGYNSNLQTLPMVQPTSAGTSVGNKKRIHKFVIKLLDSLGFKYGSTPYLLDTATINYLESIGVIFGANTSNLTEAVFRTTADRIGAALLFFTGEKSYTLRDDYGTEAQLYIRQDQPYPTNILLLAIDYETNE
ncbi:MAG: hypothetical protein ACO23R_11755 [bacterium]